jgi:hypothetical protein
METVGVMVNFPIPVLAAASKNFTAVGAVPAAGTTTGYVMEFVGLVQVVLTTQADVTPVRDEAVVASVCTGAVVVKVVDVMVRFQPLPEPVASVVVITSV